MGRKFGQCHRDGCDSEATGKLMIRFWTEGGNKDFQNVERKAMEMRCATSIQTCDRHRNMAEKFIQEPQNKLAIRTKLMSEGLNPPEWESLQLDWLPVRDGVPVDDDVAV